MTVAALTQEMIITAVSEQLQLDPNEIELDDNLLMLGLDSVRLMTLVGKWQTYNKNINFESLAEQPTLRSWIEKLSA